MENNGLPNLKVLIIEDSSDDTDQVVRQLSKEYHLVWQRIDGEAALYIALEDKWDIIICDHNLPSFDPVRALQIVRETFSPIPLEEPPFIVTSGVVNEEEAVTLLQKGAQDFIQKGHWNRLSLAIRRGLRRKGERLRDRFKIEEAYNETISAWGKALELRDIYTSGHTERVTTLSLQLAIQIGISHDDFVTLNRGALLHDIGKMGIPDAILLKRDILTHDEFAIMKSHTTIGYDMLRKISFLQNAAMILYCHHERWNGTGYPQGLEGKDNPYPGGRGIPFLARLFSIVDVYDALTSDRPYRQSWDKAKTIDYLIGERDITFDPEIVDAFVSLVGRG